MKNPTKAADNMYCVARKTAASGNEQLNSREGASALTGIERTRLARIELGLTTPYPDEVRLMAEIYNAPELMPVYCHNDCQIGQCMRDLLPSDKPASLEQIAIRSAIALRNAEQVREQLLEISADGKIAPEERQQLRSVLDVLGAISKTAMELQTVALRIDGVGVNDVGDQK